MIPVSAQVNQHVHDYSFYKKSTQHEFVTAKMRLFSYFT